MKNLLLILFFGVGSGLVLRQGSKSFYDLKALTIDGKEFRFSSLKGKKVLIVNTASRCGNTPQYEKLEALFQKYGKNNFVILGFPANNFLHQEPGTNEEIKEFCRLNYGVTFQMMSKISVKGNDLHPVYQWLTSKEKNGVMDSEVKWNFQKYLISEDGKLVNVVQPKADPFTDEIINWIEN
ncbi:MAG TPA: glutathione peroxidase [Bacteroidales bacterium]|nr:glutathione peroxidase [Bacteroidales bacterium]